MLAPRKKLWSTPQSAIEAIEELTNLQSSDTFYDIGCGDAKVLIHLAKNSNCRKFVGIEIDRDRAQEARAAVANAKLDNDVQIDIRCENALESKWNDATVIYTYLIPRGLRLLKPLLLQCVDVKQMKKPQQSTQVASEINDYSFAPTDRRREYKSCDKAMHNRQPILRVVTFMAGLGDIQHADKKLCAVEHQKDARWPVYLYHFY